MAHIYRLGESIKAGKSIPKLPSFADNLWSLTPTNRGKAIDEFLGNNLGKTFPVVDKLESQVLTSIKSLDPRGTTYTKYPRRIYNQIVSNLNNLNNFTEIRNVTLYDGTPAEMSVYQYAYDKKVLEVVPNVDLSEGQLQAINDAKAYAQSITLKNKPIELKIIILH